MISDGDWLFPKGALKREGYDVFLSPADANWRFAGLKVISLPAGSTFEFHADGIEAAIIPMAATDIDVEVAGVEYQITGREGVFAGPTDWAYAPLDSRVRIATTSFSEIAIATCVATEKKTPAYRERDSVDVEIRGAGAATREVRPFMHPQVFAGADRLMAVELVTPDGNWSSYPPHRHDGIGTCIINNEEIYYFRIGKGNSVHGDSEGWGLHRTYTSAEDLGLALDTTVTVRDGDVFIVPRGYHGPCAAAPGYPMYYLNVLAGSKPRSMAFCDDPKHSWIRQSWIEQETDPRIPWRRI